jgi:hypothetical protein
MLPYCYRAGPILTRVGVQAGDGVEIQSLDDVL